MRPAPSPSSDVSSEAPRKTIEMQLRLVFTYALKLKGHSEAPLVITNPRGLSDENVPCGAAASARLHLREAGGPPLSLGKLLFSVPRTEKMQCQAGFGLAGRTAENSLAELGRFANQRFFLANNLTLDGEDILNLSCHLSTCGPSIGSLRGQPVAQRALRASSVWTPAPTQSDPQGPPPPGAPAALFDGNPLTPW